MKKLALKVTFITFFLIQFKLTVFGGFFWPFSSHRLFSQYPKNQKSIVCAIVTNKEGFIFSKQPGRVIPIEYCRCSGLVRNIASNANSGQTKLFLQYLINRVNHSPWWAFDEMLPSVDPFIEDLWFETHLIEFHHEHPPYLRLLESERLLP